MIRLMVVLGALLAAGCGKKGPPLAPLVHIPAAVERISARRVGSDVYVTLTIPSANLDAFTPADIDRVQVFGYTGRTAPPRARFTQFGTLITTIPVAPSVPTEGHPTNAPAQGAQVSVVDTLTPDELIQGKPPEAEPGTETGTGTGTRNPEPPLRRFYIAIPFSPRGRSGPPGSVAEFPLLPVPDAPAAVDVVYDEKRISVSWQPPGGLIGFLLGRMLAEEPVPFEVEEEPARGPEGPMFYNVYRTIVDDPFAPPPPDAPAAATWAPAEPPAPLNPAPLAALEFSDSTEFNRERCYVVRAVRGTGPDAPVGVPSPPACVTPVDTFAPLPPEGLATVASAGVISLIWQPNTDLDLTGYLVLRGPAGGDTLQPLTLQPIREARYRDTDVTAGTRYVYAVVAVDNRFPVPNVSAASAAVEETAR